MNGSYKYSSQLIFASGTKTLVHSVQQFNTHDHFGKFDIFVRKVTHTRK